MHCALRHPLLHFLALGALLHGLVSLRAPKPEPITPKADEIAALRTNWQRETGRSPSAKEWQASLHRHADEERLLREALRLGLDERDPVVRERLLRNVAFVFPERALTSGRALTLARQLGMAERDLVARRRLVQLAEASLLNAAQNESWEPTSPASTYTEQRAIHQLWFEGAQGEARAHAALEALRRGETVTGDPFLLGARFAPLSEAQLAARFGPDMARAIMRAAPQTWIGPVASPYGMHLLRVERVEALRVPPAHPYRVLAERESKALRVALDRLRTRYPLQVAEAVP